MLQVDELQGLVYSFAGTFDAATYTVKAAGAFQLSISVDGTPIKGSPFATRVMLGRPPDWLHRRLLLRCLPTSAVLPGRAHGRLG